MFFLSKISLSSSSASLSASITIKIIKISDFVGVCTNPSSTAFFFELCTYARLGGRAGFQHHHYHHCHHCQHQSHRHLYPHHRHHHHHPHYCHRQCLENPRCHQRPLTLSRLNPLQSTLPSKLPEFRVTIFRSKLLNFVVKLPICKIDRQSMFLWPSLICLGNVLGWMGGG